MQRLCAGIRNGRRSNHPNRSKEVSQVGRELPVSSPTTLFSLSCYCPKHRTREQGRAVVTQEQRRGQRQSLALVSCFSSHVSECRMSSRVFHCSSRGVFVQGSKRGIRRIEPRGCVSTQLPLQLCSLVCCLERGVRSLLHARPKGAEESNQARAAACQLPTLRTAVD